MIYSLHRNGCISNGVALLVLHNAPDSAMNLLQKDEHGFSVLLPLSRQLTLMWEFITAQEDGQL